jgi:hypothetical protein
VDIKKDWANIDTNSEAEFKNLGKDVQGREEALTFYKDLLTKRNKRNEMEETVEGLVQFCTFTATVYIPHFLASSIGCDSAVNDITLCS